MSAQTTTSSGSKAHLVDISLRQGNREEAMQWLQQAPNMWMRVEPELDLSDPRFTAMLQQHGRFPDPLTVPPVRHRVPIYPYGIQATADVGVFRAPSIR